MAAQSNGRAGLRAVPRSGQPAPFPPTIPREVAPLVGREALLADIVRHVLGHGEDRARVVSLVGTGGVGKTRLAIEAASRAWDAFGGAVLHVPLAPISDPDLVLPTIVHAAGWSEQSARPALEVLVEGLAHMHALVVLDNLEHLTAARSSIADLVARCPDVTVLATSRVALRLPGERTITIPPLALPDPRAASTPRALADNEAVALLVQTARRFDPAFELTRESAAPIAQICVRLDGLPLALELAAARLRLLSAADVLALLGRELDLLRSGAADPAAPAHHQALEATIEWSARMLTPHDRARFADLCTFHGGFDLAAFSAVTGADVYDALDTLERLVDHHLVQVRRGPDDARRFDVLETIRAFGLRELAASGREHDVRRAHARWCTSLVAATAPDLTGPGQAAALRVLDREHDDIVGALAWATSGAALGDDDLPLRLVAPMWRYWWIRGQAPQGRVWTERVLALRTWPRTAALADALDAAGDLADAVGDYDAARSHFEAALEVRGELGDLDGAARCWNSLGYLARTAGDLVAAERLHAQALEALRSAGATRGVAVALNGLAAVAYLRGDIDTAAARWEEDLEVVRRLDDRMMLAMQLGNVGMARSAQGRWDLAVAAHEESLAIAREFGDVTATMLALTNLGSVLVELGEVDRAVGLLDDALELGSRVGGLLEGIAQDTYGSLERRRGRVRAAADRFASAVERFLSLGDAEHLMVSLEHLALVAAEREEWHVAFGLLLAAERRRADAGMVALGPDAEAAELARGTATALLGPSAASIARDVERWSEADLLAHVAAFARSVPADDLDATGGATPRPLERLERLGLTGREAEIAQRLVQRRTDREIAADLLVSVRTVTTHVSAVLRKLGVSSRREVGDALAARGIRVDELA